ncbi:MAG: GlcG/HbpS family heme-binding protein [Burkholderiales bacterium]
MMAASFRRTGCAILLAGMVAGAPLVALAQVPAAAPARASYGPTVTADAARKVAAAALAEAAKNGWVMAVTVVDTSGQLVHFVKMDDCQTGSIQVSIDKAKSAALFRRPSKVFNDMLAAGNTYVLALAGAVPVEGGIPLVQDGKVIGAIGVSGGTAQQDGTVAKAGAEQIR